MAHLCVISGARPHTALPLKTAKMPEHQAKPQLNGCDQKKCLGASQSHLEEQAIETQKGDETRPEVHELLVYSSDMAALPIFGNSKVCIWLCSTLLN